jgi:hypothetical protein
MRKRKDIIKEVDDLVNYWKDKHELFHGGCMFAASEIARHLEELGIPYNIIVWAPRLKSIKTSTLSEIVYDGLCYHVGISVRVGNKNVVIGGEIKYTVMFGRGLARIKRQSTAKELRKVYRDGDWNQSWNTKYNRTFKKDLNKIFESNI